MNLTIRDYKRHYGLDPSSMTKCIFEDYEEAYDWLEEGDDVASHHTAYSRRLFEAGVRRAILDNPTARLYGLEVEVPGPRRGVRTHEADTLDRLGAVRKTDGSLSEYDIEFVFPPLTASYIKRARLINRLVEALPDYREPHDDNVFGVHIHSNIGAMREEVVPLVIGTVRDNCQFFRYVAGRTGYSAYGYADRDLYTRYAACISGTIGTIEYRMFRSTADQRELDLWMDVIVALEDWAHSVPTAILPKQTEATGSIYQSSVPDIYNIDRFRAFVSANKRKYRNVERVFRAYTKAVERYPGYHHYAGGSYFMYHDIDEILPPRKKRTSGDTHATQS